MRETDPALEAAHASIRDLRVRPRPEVRQRLDAATDLFRLVGHLTLE